MTPQRAIEAASVSLIADVARYSHQREVPRQRLPSLTGAKYLDPVTSPDIRRRLWADFVKRATDQAKLSRGWSVAQIATEAKVSSATLYRWLDMKWDNAPKPALVEQFCDALDIPTGPAFAILWPGKQGPAVTAQPLVTDPDAELVQRKLNDPNTPEQEKAFLRETLRMLALRKG